MPNFNGFPNETTTFLTQLAASNTKEWFDAHRADYEQYWLAPAREFVVAAGKELVQLSPNIQAEPRVNGSIFRINRDIRFSKDKTPYKTTLDIWFWEGVRREAVSGYFLRITPHELGIGVGWLKEEFEALGVPWERRGARNDEYIAAMRALWAGPHAEFHGKFVDFPPVTCSPRPVNGNIPILVGGDTPVAIRRAARFADGYFPGTTDVEALRKLIADLGTAAKEAGRAPDEIAMHAIFGELADPISGAERLAEAGVTRAMLPAFFFAGPGGLDRLTEFGEKVVKPLAG